MPDLLLELRSEEIPARMQAKARADLARLLTDQLAAAGLAAERIETYATPRRLALIARGLPLGTPAVSEELKGPRTSAPPQALEGFLRKTGLSQDQLEDRNGTWFARIDKPGRATTDVIAEAVPAIIRAFPWPKSMRWGAASCRTESPRWVRPLQGIVAMLDEELIDFEIGEVRSSAATLGHRFHHPGPITLAGASDYMEKLRACHVIVDQDERAALIRDGAAALAAEQGLTLVPDEGLVLENAGLTEWPIPLLGRFDQAFLAVPREVIQLTMRTNQKYFALLQSSPVFAGEGDQPQAGGGAGEAGSSTLGQSTTLAETSLAPAFICVANIAATDGGERIIEGNQKVLAARLADARFFWEQDLKIPLEDQAAKLGQIVFHEKLGTLADKVDRVAKLARWLVEEGIVTTSPSPPRGEGASRSEAGEGLASSSSQTLTLPLASGERAPPSPLQGEGREHLAALAERAARLCKADLVTQMVGEFPELQGLIGGYLAEAQGEHPQVAAAIRDHYKPVGQGDEVPTDPVTVAVSLADKLDTLVSFFAIDERPTGSRDPFALRRAALGAIALTLSNDLRFPLANVLELHAATSATFMCDGDIKQHAAALGIPLNKHGGLACSVEEDMNAYVFIDAEGGRQRVTLSAEQEVRRRLSATLFETVASDPHRYLDFFADRLKVQQREAGVRHDLIDAVFALGGEDDLVRLLARVRALQSFVETPAGADLLAATKRAANILKKEGWDHQRPSPLQGRGARGEAERGEGESDSSPLPASLRSPTLSPEGERDQKKLSYTPEPAETALIAALDSAEPEAAAAVEREDFEAAMRALATLRAPVDAFFNEVTVNDPDPAKREARLDLLARMRAAVHRVADFSRIEG